MDNIEAHIERVARRAASRAVSEALPEALARLNRSESGAGRLLRESELAKHLAVSVKTVRRLRREGLPCVRVRSGVRFDLDVVLTWLAGREGGAV